MVKDLRFEPNGDEIVRLFVGVYCNANTRARYRTVVTQYLARFSVRTSKDLDQDPYLIVSRVQEFCDQAQSSAAYNSRLACLRAFYGFLEATYEIRNPLSRATVRFRRVGARSKTRSLNERQLRKLLSSLKRSANSFTEMRDYLLIKSLALTSVRISEALQLRLFQMERSSGTWFQVITQKGGRDRIVVIPFELHSEYVDFSKRFGVDVILCKQDGTQITREHAFKIVRERIKDVLGITDASPHSLRKTFIELAQSQNVNPVEIMNSTGHTHMNMIAYYDNRSPLKHNASSILTKLTR